MARAGKLCPYHRRPLPCPVAEPAGLIKHAHDELVGPRVSVWRIGWVWNREPGNAASPFKNAQQRCDKELMLGRGGGKSLRALAMRFLNATPACVTGLSLGEHCQSEAERSFRFGGNKRRCRRPREEGARCRVRRGITGVGLGTEPPARARRP
jgi:hypothetical protein